MSHTPPKKRPNNHPQKRIQINDDDGWTHITTTTASRGRKGGGKKNSKGNNGGYTSRNQTPAIIHDNLVPAEIPLNLTFSGLQEKYLLHQRRWEESECWSAAKAGLERGFSSSSSNTGEWLGRRRIDKCVCIGLGSPSGFLRGGWVDRRAISLYQLAGLVCMMGWISPPAGPGSGIIKRIYAQDPVFNKMDRELLSSLGIEVVDDPAAFDLVDQHTFLYCPGAERSHLVDLLRKDPVLFFGGPLEDGFGSLLYGRYAPFPVEFWFGANNEAFRNEQEEYILSQFSGTREMIQLPPFEPDEHAFWKMGLYWKREGVD